MAYLEELLPEFRKGTKIRQPNWEKGEYIYLGENGIVYDERNKPFNFTNEEIFSEWKLYQEPKLDWDYIIKNKCLCCFWDDNSVFGIRLGYLTKLMFNFPNKKEFNYCKDNGGAFKYCRPVRKDEVTFYEDKKR